MRPHTNNLNPMLKSNGCNHIIVVSTSGIQLMQPRGGPGKTVGGREGDH